jgi:chemotaxis protein CheY-P-specific phosphatase CheC
MPLDTLNPSVEQALSEALETMAFITPLPPEDAAAPAGPAVLTRIEFRGPLEGALEVVAPDLFGAALAANLLGVDPTDPDAKLKGSDALRELLNIACGTLLRSTGATASGLLSMGVPTQDAFDLAEWDAFVKSDAAVVVDADGQKIAARLVELE